MSEMVERVARAMHHAAYSSVPWDALEDGSRAFVCRMARGVIEAMREPTEAMVVAGQEEELSRTEDVKAIYRAMIDAALKD